MAESSNPALNVAPFPPLHWDEFYWTGKVVLKSWQGFQCRLGSYAAQSSDEESDGTVFLNVAPPGRTADQQPTAEQATAFRYLVEHDEEIRDAIVAAVLEDYPRLRQNMLANGFVEEDEMPILENADQVKEHVGLNTIHISSVTRDGAAYVGFEFGCTWDDEHGMGFMTHHGRIVELPMDMGKMGQADIASEDWVAEEDPEMAG